MNQEPRQLLLRPAASVRLVCGVVGAIGVLLGVCAVLAPPNTWTELAVIALGGTASAAFSLFYWTTEIHATSERLWLRRYGMTAWSVPMRLAGTVEGTGWDWRLIYVFNLNTNLRVGAINWWVLEEPQRMELATFVDEAREAQAVKFQVAQPRAADAFQRGF